MATTIHPRDSKPNIQVKIKVNAHPGESTDEEQRLLIERSSRISPKVLRRKGSPTRVQHKAGVSEL